MLLIIKIGTMSFIGEIHDESYESVSKAFEEIGHPELTIVPSIDKLKINEKYNLYDFDDLAELLQNNIKITLNDVTNISYIGSVVISDKKYIYCNDSDCIDVEV